MALRVPKAKLTTELSENMIKQFGVVPESIEVTWHHPKVAEVSLELGGRVSEWDAADESLKSFAHIAVAAQTDGDLAAALGRITAKTFVLPISRLPATMLSDRFRLAVEQGTSVRPASCSTRTPRSAAPWCSSPMRAGTELTVTIRPASALQAVGAQMAHEFQRRRLDLLAAWQARRAAGHICVPRTHSTA